MTTLNHIIYNIKNLAWGGLSSDDSPISDDQIAYWANVERTVLIKQDLERNKIIHTDLIQDLGCIEIECVDVIECCQLGLNSGSNHYRTKQQIPVPISISWDALSNPMLITYVGLLGAYQPFEFTSRALANRTKNLKYGKGVRAYYLKNRIYFEQLYDRDIEAISIQGVFENPAEAASFANCCGDGGNYDFPYPITAYLESPLKEIIMKKYLNYVMNPGAQDVSNDTENTIVGMKGGVQRSGEGN